MTQENIAVVIPESILCQDVGGEMVILDIERGGYYGLNELGSRIWVLLQQGSGMPEIFAALLKEYDVSEDRLRGDIEQFLLQLQAEGLIELHDKQAT